MGNQSLVVALDIKKKMFAGNYEIVTHNAKKHTGINPVDFVKELEQLGVGELVINSVDKDGTITGYDLNIINKIRD